MDSRQIEQAEIREIYGSFGGVKSAREHQKSKRKGRLSGVEWNDEKEGK